jgi:hypothetical protein
MVLAIVFLVAWTVVGALAQYQCLPTTVCQQTETYCPDTCGTGCSGVTAKGYTYNSVNVLATSGPCANNTPSDVPCSYTKNCGSTMKEGMSCQWDYNNKYCEGPYVDGNWCQSCSNTTNSAPVPVTSYTCTNCAS